MPLENIRKCGTLNIEPRQMYFLGFTFMSFGSNLIAQWKHFKFYALLHSCRETEYATV